MIYRHDYPACSRSQTGGCLAGRKHLCIQWVRRLGMKQLSQLVTSSSA